MNSCKKTVICLLTLVLLLGSLTSCIDGKKAKGTVEDFLSAVEAGDFETAKTYLHPERPADLSTYFGNVEATEQVDFQSGIAITKYTGVKSSHYDSSVGGSVYETTARAKLDGKSVTITVEIVENEAGYGIYNFNIDF